MLPVTSLPNSFCLRIRGDIFKLGIKTSTNPVIHCPALSVLTMCCIKLCTERSNFSERLHFSPEKKTRSDPSTFDLAHSPGSVGSICNSMGNSRQHSSFSTQECCSLWPYGKINGNWKISNKNHTSVAVLIYKGKRTRWKQFFWLYVLTLLSVAEELVFHS